MLVFPLKSSKERNPSFLHLGFQMSNNLGQEKEQTLQEVKRFRTSLNDTNWSSIILVSTDPSELFDTSILELKKTL